MPRTERPRQEASNRANRIAGLEKEIAELEAELE